MPPDQSTDLEDLLHGLPARDEIPPPVISRRQVLPFNQLSWENFERLCTRLIATDSDVVDCHRYGKRGDYQAGIDILADRRTGDGEQERWGYQCKRWKKMSSGDLGHIVDKFTFPAEKYRVLVSFEANADLRQVVANLLEIDLWDAEDLSGQLKEQPRLVEDFFGPAWRGQFCTVESEPSSHCPENPFTESVAIRDPVRFIGRKKVLEDLLCTLKGSSVALVGERKIGKTSLLYRLMERLSEIPGQVVVSWDFHDPVDVTRLRAHVIRQLGSNGESWEDLKRAVQGRQIVILLDEFELAPERGFDLDHLRGCRALCQRERGLHLVTASRVLPKEIFPTRVASWPYDFLLPQQLGPFTVDEARQLLAHPWMPDALHCDIPTRDELVRLSGCHPFRLQRAAYHCYAALCDSAYNWHAAYDLDMEALG